MVGAVCQSAIPPSRDIRTLRVEDKDARKEATREEEDAEEAMLQARPLLERSRKY